MAGLDVRLTKGPLTPATTAGGRAFGHRFTPADPPRRAEGQRGAPSRHFLERMGIFTPTDGSGW
jgi:hypothetical protein